MYRTISISGLPLFAGAFVTAAHVPAASGMISQPYKLRWERAQLAQEALPDDAATCMGDVPRTLPGPRARGEGGGKQATA